MTCSGQFVAQEQIQPTSAHTHLIASHPKKSSNWQELCLFIKKKRIDQFIRKIGRKPIASHPMDIKDE